MGKTKIKDDELLDLVNEKDEVIGTVYRKEAQKDPSKIYRIVSVTIFNKKGETLIQQRSMNKSHPGSWENSASGHVLAGEKPELSAKRELMEELGIKTGLIFYDKWFIVKPNKRKFMWMYCGIVEHLDIKFDRDEIANIRWIKPEDLGEFAKNNQWDLNGYSHKEIMQAKQFLKI